MSLENIPNYGDNTGEEQPRSPEAVDFERWEGELASNEQVIRLTYALGELALEDQVSIEESDENGKDEIVEISDESSDQIQPFRTEMPTPDKQEHSAETFSLLDESLGRTALEMIYITTGIPADNVFTH